MAWNNISFILDRLFYAIASEVSNVYILSGQKLI